jgi:pyruvate/2-oxoglutarate dehydrogenase complex dihydrolipoamide dehydrogenase (E3) component
MSEFDYDLFVIGAGSGGVRASARRGRARREASRLPRNIASAAPA